MIELLNPTLGGASRFAADVAKFRLAYARASATKATALAVDRFCTPSGRRNLPDWQGLVTDAERYAGVALESVSREVIEGVQHVLQSTQQSHTEVAGQRVALYHWKPKKQAKKRALLVHGWEGYALNYAHLIAQLLAAGFEVHAFDHAAHGQSQGSRSALPDFIRTLAHVAPELAGGKPWELAVGHSLGGGALAYAQANGLIRAQKLALLAPFLDTPQLLRRWCQLHALGGKAALLMQEEIVAQSVVPGMRMEDTLPQTLAQQLAVPTLIVHDAKDIVVPIPHSRTLAKLSPHVRLQEPTALGHVGVLFDNTVASQVLAHALG